MFAKRRRRGPLQIGCLSRRRSYSAKTSRRINSAERPSARRWWMVQTHRKWLSPRRNRRHRMSGASVSVNPRSRSDVQVRLESMLLFRRRQVPPILEIERNVYLCVDDLDRRVETLPVKARSQTGMSIDHAPPRAPERLDVQTRDQGNQKPRDRHTVPDAGRTASGTACPPASATGRYWSSMTSCVFIRSFPGECDRELNRRPTTIRGPPRPTHRLSAARRA